MNIFGIGTDIVSVNRIKNSLKNINYIEAFKGIFLALLVILFILVLQAMGIIESVTVVIVLIVMLKDLQQKRLFQKLWEQEYLMV